MRFALLLLLTGCTVTPTTYERRAWAKVELEQAQNECYVAIQKNNEISITTCLRSKGWFERSVR